MKLIDDNLLQYPFEPRYGPDISGKPNPPLPTWFGYNDLAGGVREFYVGGPGGTDILYAVHRPVGHKKGMVHLNLDVMTDGSSYSLLRCLEIDSIITFKDARSKVGGYKSNMSAQFNHNSGYFEIAGQDGGWLTTGLKVGRFLPWQWYSLQFDYWYDAQALKHSFYGMTLNDQPRYLAPLSMQNLNAVESNWDEVISLQCPQLDIDEGAGGKLSVFTRNVRYTWDM